MSVLETSKLFSGLSSAENELLRNAVRLENFPPNHLIFTEGDEGDGLYLIESGQVVISALVNGNERRTLTRLGPGEFFGEMSVVDQEPRSATAIAEQETRVHFIPRQTVVDLLDNSPHLAINLVREFSFRLREFNRHYIREVLETERLALVGRFARAIVHDFKNPLNVIAIAADLGGMEHATLEMRQMARQRIQKQVDRLSSMINELLEFTRGSQANVVLAETNYRLYIERVLEEMQPEASDSSVSLRCENEPPDVAVLLDPNRLRHVFSNLINNAMDAMPEGGQILFRFMTEDKAVVTEIEDTGPGLASEIVPRLFEVFATYGKAQGTGLGLSICRKIIEDHRGRIEARHEPGRGAIFRFALPRPQ